MANALRPLGIAGLLVLIAAPSAAKVRPDWSKVTFLSPGTRVVVVPYDDAAPATDRRIKGRFLSATSHGLTLALRDGSSRTLEKAAVRQVLIRVFPFQRKTFLISWVALSAAILAPVGGDRFTNVPRSIGAYVATTAALAGIVHWALPLKGVYHVPPDP